MDVAQQKSNPLKLLAGGASNHYEPDDEIDLFDLFETIWDKKYLISVVVFLCLLLASVYIAFGPRVYETQAIVLAPEKKSLIELSAPGVAPVSPDFVFNIFLANVMSPDVHLKVVGEDALKTHFYVNETVSDMDVMKVVKDDFHVALPEEPKKKLLVENLKAASISFQADPDEISYAFLERVIVYSEAAAKAEARGSILADLTRNITNKKRQYELKNDALDKEIESEIERLLESDRLASAELTKQIEFVQKKALRDRNDRITRLEELLAVSKRLGITTPVMPFDYQRVSSSADARIDIASQEPGGYWLGEKILSAEIESLRSREDDSPFIAELTELRKKLGMLATNERVDVLKKRQSNLPFSEGLRNLRNEIATLELAIEKINKATFDVFKYTQQPLFPTKPVKPRKALLLVASLVFGLIFGSSIALISGSLQKRRSKEQIESMVKPEALVAS